MPFTVSNKRLKKLITTAVIASIVIGVNFLPQNVSAPGEPVAPVDSVAGKALETLAVKGRAQKNKLHSTAVYERLE